MTVKTDSDLAVQTAVQEEFEWTPEIADAASIGVAVEDGAVMLSGEVRTFAEWSAVKRAALRVRGVVTIVDDITIHPSGPWAESEPDIAKQIRRALRGSAMVPETVKAEIHGHDVVLLGEVDWDYQRQAAKRAIRDLRGVKSVTSMITLSDRPSSEDAEERIRNAITRNALLDAHHINVEMDGTRAVLHGTVRSWAEKRQAEQAAWASPHVTEVDNCIMVHAW
ncbi:ornithine aminotransferase [Tersicoccus solisilvae]|uniref:Ornithine aminotransferase n=1 Tax=Tersicoccus solisilvae TaxID=1882339 RepID=A0ABQ1P8Y6_9MICC|nr:BON domain-containing protein [Tersicoccus solisilvae]GGC89129.1 ornithine aminotransferase [Tersicoccus solisilvae]